jgi:hypothetical protein
MGQVLACPVGFVRITLYSDLRPPDERSGQRRWLGGHSGSNEVAHRAATEAAPVVVVGVGVAVMIAFAAAAVSAVRAHKRPLALAPPAYRRPGLYRFTSVDDAAASSRALQRLDKLLIVAMAGYLFFDRAFAWIHVPGTPAFVGELVIGYGILTMFAVHPRLSVAFGLTSSFKALVAYMAWGSLLLVMAIPTYGLDAVRDAALWYYGIIAIFIFVLAWSRPTRVVRWLELFGKAIPYMLIWFPVAVILDSVFRDRVPHIPDSFIPVTAHRVGNMAVMAAAGVGFLWLVDRDSEMYSERQRVGLTALGTIVIVFAGMKNRGGFLAAAAALAIAMVFMRRKRSEITIIMIGAVVTLLTIGLLGNVKIGLFGDDREVSVEQLLQNISSIVDSSSGGKRQEETITWRLQIWTRVLDEVSTDFPLTGFGPGPDLGEHFGISGDGDVPLRNPHNSHVGVLARSGFVGVTLWVVIWLVWAAELLNTRRRLLARWRRREAGVVVWLIVTCVAILTNAIFDPALEGPQVAWWLWGALGLGIVIMVLERTGRLPDLQFANQIGDRELVTSSGKLAGRAGG